MNTIKKANESLKEKSKAKVIPLYAFNKTHTPETQKLINTIWNVSQSALWFDKNFSPREKGNIKDLIAKHFYNGKSNAQNFKELIELLCLAKRYAAKGNSSNWLEIRQSLELESIEICLDQLRNAAPENNKGIPTLIAAISRFIKSPSNTTYYKYRRLLMEQKQYDLLQILNNTIIHMQYSL
jgi:hypothetical protein